MEKYMKNCEKRKYMKMEMTSKFKRRRKEPLEAMLSKD